MNTVAATSDNSGHTVTLRYAQIRQNRTSHVRKTLYERLCLEGR